MSWTVYIYQTISREQQFDVEGDEPPTPAEIRQLAYDSGDWDESIADEETAAWPTED